MSKIKDALLDAEEINPEEFHEAWDEWELSKLNQIVFTSKVVDGKKVITNK